MDKNNLLRDTGVFSRKQGAEALVLQHSGMAVKWSVRWPLWLENTRVETGLSLFTR